MRKASLSARAWPRNKSSPCYVLHTQNSATLRMQEQPSNSVQAQGHVVVDVLLSLYMHMYMYAL